MEVHPKKPTAKGPTEWFTGDVWIDGIGQGRGPSPVTIGSVHFTPGARSAWHSHSVGQTLYVTEGEGRVQSRGGPVLTGPSQPPSVRGVGILHAVLCPPGASRRPKTLNPQPETRVKDETISACMTPTPECRRHGAP